jgi:DNA-binding MarR family transcriptional regulator
MTAATKPALSPRPDVKQRLRLWIRLLRATRAIEAQVRDRLRVQFAMTLPQFDVMAALYREEVGMTMTELSRRLMVSNGNATVLVSGLEGEGMVRRTVSSEDRRSVTVALTDQGRAAFAAMAAAHALWVDELLGGLGDDEVEQLSDLLHRARLQVEEREGAG